MEVDELYTLTLTFVNDEVLILKELVHKLFTKPESVGFIKRDFTDAERELLHKLYEQFNYDGKELPHVITGAPDVSTYKNTTDTGG